MSDKKDQIEQELLEVQLALERANLKETEDQCRFNEQERNYIRTQWSLDKHVSEQEVNRRAIEVCINVLRHKDNVADDACTLANTKLRELIPKLG